MAYKKSLDLIFCRPSEPSFLPKGNSDIQRRFDVPDKFIPTRYKSASVYMTEDEAGQVQKYKPTKISVKDFEPPDIEFAIKGIGRHDLFSSYFPVHRKIASRLIDLFLRCDTVEQLESLALYCRDRLNPVLFNIALAIAIMNRKDTQDFVIPTVAELFPDKFVKGNAFQGAREELVVVPEGSRVSVWTERGSLDLFLIFIVNLGPCNNTPSRHSLPCE